MAYGRADCGGIKKHVIFARKAEGEGHKAKGGKTELGT
jgi:hypothetical protein